MNWTLVPNFNEDEFRCPCCGIVNISKKLIQMLQKARTISGVTYHISSGCRCKKHNASDEVKGAPTSAHITSRTRKGKAVDIETRTDMDRFYILKGLLLAGFNRLGIYEKHIHTDVSRSKKPNVTWYV